jgi:hypothetical protein
MPIGLSVLISHTARCGLHTRPETAARKASALSTRGAMESRFTLALVCNSQVTCLLRVMVGTSRMV